MSNKLISYFNSGEFSQVAGEVDLLQYLDYIKGGRWQDLVLAVRTGRRDKKEVPSVTASGVFEERRVKDKLRAHSGIIAIDLDDSDNPEVLELRERLEQDPYTLALHTSIRGFGLVIYVKIDPSRHLDAYLALERYYANTYNLITDPSCKDTTRLRFVSYDPEVYLNQKAKKWTKYLNKKEQAPAKAEKVIPYHNDDIGYILNQIQDRGINIAEDYHHWLYISFALASEFGEAGRDYFHTVSRQSSKYDAAKCDKQFDIALKRDNAGITIGTFFFHCKEAGIETMTQETKDAISIYRQRLKMEPGRSRKEASEATVEYLEKMQGMAPERVQAVLDKVEDIPLSVLDNQKLNDKITEIENFIKQLGLRFNTISRKIELDGRPVDDRDINTIYRKALHAVDDKLTKNRLWDLIDSDLIEQYNPFLEFIKKNKHLKPEGTIAELIDCIKYEAPSLDITSLTEDEKIADYLEVFLTRWLVGIISSMHGTYSLLVLVLTGGQGTGKSRFFRELWPDELKPYYAESKLDSNKDDGILMTQKLCIMDDEFSGKSKTEARKFKEISSRDMFTVRKPYGKVFEDLPRYAVLCGTSNEEQIINDPTGNRRLIPINITDIDLEKFAAIDKVELFMELYWLWREVGDKWMLTRDEIEFLNKSTVKNESTSFEAEMILKYFEAAESKGGNVVELTTSEIKQRIDQRTGERVYVNKLGPVLKSLGFEQLRVRRGAHVHKVYRVIDHYDYNNPI